MLFLLQFILPLLFSKQLKIPDVKVYNELIKSTSYINNERQQLTLTYDSYGGCFAMQLLQKIEQSDQKNLIYKDINNESLCQPIQRELEISKKNQLGFFIDQNIYFTDVIAIPQLNKVIGVNNNFEIIQADVIADKKEQFIKNIKSRKDSIISFKQSLNLSESNFIDTAHPYLILDPDTNFIYMISSQGSLSFSGQDKKKGQKLTFENQNIIQRDRIEDVHYLSVKKMIIVAAGQDGIDFYKINSDNQLDHKITFTGKLLGLDNINAKDVEVSDDLKYMYVLDPIKGLLFVDITNINSPKLLKMQIPIQRGVTFDHKNQTFIVIAQTVHNRDYAVEIFVNLKKQEYYFNQFFVDLSELYHIIMFDRFAVLIGVDAHKLIYHSIYKGFIDDKQQHQSIFEEDNLVKVLEYKSSNDPEQVNLIGITDYEFKSFHINEIKPRVQCVGLKNQKQDFKLFLNSTNCNTKTKKNDLSQYSQCQIKHSFSFSTNNVSFTYLEYQQVYITSQSEYLLIIGYLLLFVALGGIIYLFCYFYRRWSLHIAILQSKSLHLKQEEHYGNLKNEQKA